MSNHEPLRKSKRLCARCNKRRPIVRLPGFKDVMGRMRKEVVVRMKHHDVCQQCWRELQGDKTPRREQFFLPNETRETPGAEERRL